jgi:hypothetical protein
MDCVARLIVALRVPLGTRRRRRAVGRSGAVLVGLISCGVCRESRQQPGPPVPERLMRFVAGEWPGRLS